MVNLWSAQNAIDLICWRWEDIDFNGNWEDMVPDVLKDLNIEDEEEKAIITESARFLLGETDGNSNYKDLIVEELLKSKQNGKYTLPETVFVVSGKVNIMEKDDVLKALHKAYCMGIVDDQDLADVFAKQYLFAVAEGNSPEARNDDDEYAKISYLYGEIPRQMHVNEELIKASFVAAVESGDLDALKMAYTASCNRSHSVGEFRFLKEAMADLEQEFVADSSIQSQRDDENNPVL